MIILNAELAHFSGQLSYIGFISVSLRVLCGELPL